MRNLIVVTVVAIAAAAGCGGSGHTDRPPAGPTPEANPTSPRAPTRAAKYDSSCTDDAARPQAYEYPDQQTAEAAGCEVRRLYGEIEDHATGKMMENEVWFFCCPAR